MKKACIIFLVSVFSSVFLGELCSFAVEDTIILNTNFLSDEINSSIRKAKADYPITILKRKSQDGEFATILIASVNGHEDRRVIEDLGKEIKHLSELEGRTSSQIRAVNFLMKGVAIALTAYYLHRSFDFKNYQDDKMRRYLEEREKIELENESGNISDNSVENEIKNDEFHLKLSGIYSIYMAFGHFLKPFIGQNSYYQFLFPHEGLAFQSEIDDLMRRIDSAITYESTIHQFLFLVQSNYYRPLIDQLLESDRIEEIEFQKFKDDEVS